MLPWLREVIMKIRFNKEKGIQILRYFVNKGLHDLYQIGKAMYFADRYHLEHHGYFIADDVYIAMDAGPVPSGFYDILKEVRTSKSAYGVIAEKNDFISAQAADLSYFSPADVKSLEYGIDQVRGRNFGEIKEKSHDDAYYKTELNKQIRMTDIAEMLDPSGELLEYLAR